MSRNRRGSKPRLVLLGGFLGSGKTTLMMNLGETLAAEGYSVAVVTNDQGEFLVDTAYARSRGVAAGEVLSGCFCCNFNDLVANLEGFETASKPDFIFAEPVGSCTDLAATVLAPLDLYHRDLVSLGPFLVLADGSRLNGEYRDLSLENPLTPKEVLLSHQIREAPHILLSKTDLCDPPALRHAETRLSALAPEATIIPCSTVTGEGLDVILGLIRSEQAYRVPPSVGIDYDVYAAAEAELGWYNGILTVKGESGFAVDELVLDLVEGIKNAFGTDVAHAKVWAATARGIIKISLAGGRIRADAAMEAGVAVTEAGLTVNLRVQRPPEEIREAVESLLAEVASGRNLIQSGYRWEALVPGAPRPTHRIADSGPG